METLIDKNKKNGLSKAIEDNSIHELRFYAELKQLQKKYERLMALKSEHDYSIKIDVEFFMKSKKYTENV